MSTRKPNTGDSFALAGLVCFSSLLLMAGEATADQSFECSTHLGSQVEIADCVAEVESNVDKTVELALGFAMASATDLDQVTGRSAAAPALEAGQTAWSAYRDAHCEFVGATFGGGSGTGIAIRSCRVDLGRARVEELMHYVQ